MSRSLLHKKTNLGYRILCLLVAWRPRDPFNDDNDPDYIYTPTVDDDNLSLMTTILQTMNSLHTDNQLFLDPLPNSSNNDWKKIQTHPLFPWTYLTRLSRYPTTLPKKPILDLPSL
jgi:hypothetical protein